MAIDPYEIHEWTKVYFAEAVKLGAPHGPARRWAKSMALIAEQHLDDDEPDEVELTS